MMGNCFGGAVLILSELNGVLREVPIEKLDDYPVVASWDRARHALVMRPARRILISGLKDTLRVGAHYRHSSLEVTYDQRFPTTTGNKRAHDLKKGDYLYTWRKATVVTARVTDIVAERDPQVVYDIAFDSPGTIVANGILAHACVPKSTIRRMFEVDFKGFIPVPAGIGKPSGQAYAAIPSGHIGM